MNKDPYIGKLYEMSFIATKPLFIVIKRDNNRNQEEITQTYTVYLVEQQEYSHMFVKSIQEWLATKDIVEMT